VGNSIAKVIDKFKLRSMVEVLMLFQQVASSYKSAGKPGLLYLRRDERMIGT
jgi:hypothetical protein